MDGEKRTVLTQRMQGLFAKVPITQEIVFLAVISTMDTFGTKTKAAANAALTAKPAPGIPKIAPRVQQIPLST